MATTIRKYTLSPQTSLMLPEGAKVLHVREQNFALCIWVLVDPDKPKAPRQFSVYGTGRAMPVDPGAYIGTAHLSDSTLVFHVFEDAPP